MLLSPQASCTLIAKSKYTLAKGKRGSYITASVCQLLLLTGFRLSCVAEWSAWEQAKAWGPNGQGAEYWVPLGWGMPYEAGAGGSWPGLGLQP